MATNGTWGFELPYGATWGLNYPTRTRSYSLPQTADFSSSASALSQLSKMGGGLSAGGAAGAAGGAAIGMMVGKAIGDTYSVWNQGRTQRYVLKQQARIADSNAALAQMGVEQAFRAGESEVAALTLQAAQTKASQRTAFAANGIAVDGSGTTAELYADTDLKKEVDKNTALNNALATAWGYRRQKIGYETEAAIDRKMGRSLRGLWNMSAFSTLLNSGSQVASTWYDLSGRGRKAVWL